MNISSIVDIVQGELLNSPSISSVYNIKSNPNKVLEGDLFIAQNANDAKLAVQNGAFAIIFDFKIELNDKEIAWIKVNSSYDALVKIFRYRLSNLELEVFLCKEPIYKLLKLFLKAKKNIKFIDNSIFEYTNILEYINEDKILVSCENELLRKIYPKYKNFELNSYKIENLIEHSLFETSFSYKDKYFSRIKLPSLYINEFLDIYKYFNEEVDLKKLNSFTLFKPIFLDKFLDSTEYGKSNKFILCSKNLETANDEISHILKKYKYGKIIILSSRKLERANFSYSILEDINLLKKYLSRIDFNLAYILGYESSFIQEIINKQSHHENNLF